MNSGTQLGWDFAPPVQNPSDRIGDITQAKHGGNAHSRRAYDISRHSAKAMRERIRLFVASQGFHGATIKEWAVLVEKQLNQLSGRFSELKADGEIFDSHREREHCTVWVTRKEWQSGSAR